jgi:hypothetical protein
LTVGTQNQDTVFLHDGHFYVERESDPFVRIPTNLFKGIVFIGAVAGYNDSGDPYGDIQGTGFFVRVPSAIDPILSHLYLVTAKHVIEDLGTSDAYILVNGKDGKAKPLKQLGPKWWKHPSDNTADVIVRQVAAQKGVEGWGAKIDDFITPEDIKKETVCVGDEVFLAGYFSPISSDRNLPIVRHGNIAMLPDEQIQTEHGMADVYLIEARSIGGISGSLVAVRPPLRYGIDMPKGTMAYFDAIGKYKLLGVMHGHWDIKESKMNDPKIEHDRKHGVNMGIGIVVPAIKILETINQPGLVELRRLGDEDMARQSKSVPGMDSVRRTKPEETKPVFTKADFEDALKKASRKKQ